MPVQEPVLRAVNLRFGWGSPPRFVDVRGALTELLRQATESPDDWTWDEGLTGPVVAAWNDKQRLHLLASPEGLSLVSELPDATALEGAAARTVGPCLDLLEVRELDHCGAGATWTLAAADARDAEAALEGWLFRSDFRTRLEPVGGRPDDLVVTMVFGAEREVSSILRAEPVTDEEAVDIFFLSEMERSEFPPAALLADFQRRHEHGFGAADGTARAVKHLDQLVTQAEKFLATVGDPDAGA